MTEALLALVSFMGTVIILLLGYIGREMLRRLTNVEKNTAVMSKGFLRLALRTERLEEMHRERSHRRARPHDP